jgi:hypothetical protein
MDKQIDVAFVTRMVSEPFIEDILNHVEVIGVPPWDILQKAKGGNVITRPRCSSNSMQSFDQFLAVLGNISPASKVTMVSAAEKRFEFAYARTWQPDLTDRARARDYSFTLAVQTGLAD